MKSDLIINPFQEWSHLIKSIITRNFNFFTFSVLSCDIEVCRITGRIEINLAIFGFGLFIAIPFKQMDDELEDRIDEVKKTAGKNA